MIEKSARILRLEGELAVLEVTQQTACSTCSVKSSCGSSVLSGVFGRSTTFRAYNPIKATPGSTVTVGIPEHVLLKASLYMYLLPLVLMIAFAAAVPLFMAESSVAEVASLLSGMAGLALGILVYKWVAFRLQSNPANLPVLIKQCSPIDATIV